MSEKTIKVSALVILIACVAALGTASYFMQQQVKDPAVKYSIYGETVQPNNPATKSVNVDSYRDLGNGCIEADGQTICGSYTIKQN